MAGAFAFGSMDDMVRNTSSLLPNYSSLGNNAQLLRCREVIEDVRCLLKVTAIHTNLHFIGSHGGNRRRITHDLMPILQLCVHYRENGNLEFLILTSISLNLYQTRSWYCHKRALDRYWRKQNSNGALVRKLTLVTISGNNILGERNRYVDGGAAATGWRNAFYLRVITYVAGVDVVLPK